MSKWSTTVFLKLCLRNLKFWEKKSTFCTSYCSTVQCGWLSDYCFQWGAGQTDIWQAAFSWIIGVFFYRRKSRFSGVLPANTNLLSSLWRPFHVAFIIKYLYISFLYSVSTMPTMLSFHFPGDSNKGVCAVSSPSTKPWFFFRFWVTHVLKIAACIRGETQWYCSNLRL